MSRMLPPVVVTILCGALLFVAPRRELEKQEDAFGLAEMRCTRNEDGSGMIYVLDGNVDENLRLVLYTEKNRTAIPVSRTITNPNGSVDLVFVLPEIDREFSHGNLVGLKMMRPWWSLGYGALCITLLILVCGILIWRHRRRTSGILYLEVVRYDGPKDGDVVIDM